MKEFLSILAMTTISASAFAATPQHTIRFSELPFTEGTIYISATCGDRELIRSAIEVTEDCVSLDIDLSPVVGKEVSIQAFQDLDDNKRLDTDSYGRPTEPYLRTVITPQEEASVYTLKLVCY